MGMRSDNEGLRKSSIYIAGFYNIQELVAPLIQILIGESDINIKVLAALALYKIGDSSGIKAISELQVQKELNTVNRIGKTILEKLVINSANDVTIK